MSCLPSKSKCEWFELRDFIRHYNELCGTTYEREKCLDVADSTRPQPEVLVQCVGARSMVIERKSVVWPPAHVKDHNKEHTLMAALAEALNPLFQDKAYALELSATDISAKEASQMTVFSKQIAGMIIEHRDAVARGQISGTLPLPWAFGANDDPESRPGVTILVSLSRNLFDFDYCERALQGGATELAKQLEKAVPKFVGYESCVRTVVIQFYGEDFSSERVEEMVSRITVPNTIDQVWLTYSEPISDHEYETKYHRVHPMNA